MKLRLRGDVAWQLLVASQERRQLLECLSMLLEINFAGRCLSRVE